MTLTMQINDADASDTSLLSTIGLVVDPKVHGNRTVEACQACAERGGTGYSWLSGCRKQQQ